MSLRGRKFFDTLKHQWMNSSRFRLPCAPYHNPDYWDSVYKNMDSEEVYEWGGFDLHSGLRQFRYENLLHHGDNGGLLPQEHSPEEGVVHTTTFAELMNIPQYSNPEEAIVRYDELQTSNNNNNSNESLLVLGCGTSKFGEQLLMDSFAGPVLQLDVSSKVIHLMTQRYQKYLQEASVKRMEFIVDDARGLTSLSPESVGGGVLDKGLIDVLHCSADVISMEDDYENNNKSDYDIGDIVDSVHKVLQPSRPFVFFSNSGYEYILRRTLGSVEWNREVRQKWMNIQVMKLVDFDVYLYRFVKADAEADAAAEVAAGRNHILKPSKKRRRR